MTMIRTKEEYIQSLKDLGHVVYYKGERVRDITNHAAFIPRINFFQRDSFLVPFHYHSIIFCKNQNGDYVWNLHYQYPLN
jgi:aromatic ring hydroxylase